MIPLLHGNNAALQETGVLSWGFQPIVAKEANYSVAPSCVLPLKTIDGRAVVMWLETSVCKIGEAIDGTGIYKFYRYSDRYMEASLAILDVKNQDIIKTVIKDWFIYGEDTTNALEACWTKEQHRQAKIWDVNRTIPLLVSVWIFDENYEQSCIGPMGDPYLKETLCRKYSLG